MRLWIAAGRMAIAKFSREKSRRRRARGQVFSTRYRRPCRSRAQCGAERRVTSRDGWSHLPGAPERRVRLGFSEQPRPQFAPHRSSGSSVVHSVRF